MSFEFPELLNRCPNKLHQLLFQLLCIHTINSIISDLNLVLNQFMCLEYLESFLLLSVPPILFSTLPHSILLSLYDLMSLQHLDPSFHYIQFIKLISYLAHLSLFNLMILIHLESIYGFSEKSFIAVLFSKIIKTSQIQSNCHY